jgi:benzoyl-CoA reductase/2-hydroxyglutaryl-CoA dehydratase subunit BcrC/BadD/HgdB
MTATATKKRGRALNASNQARVVLKDYWEGAARHKAEGRPVAWVSGNVPIELFWAMGVYPVYPENYSAVCASIQQSLELCERAEEKGYSIDLCSYSRVNLGIVLGKGIDDPELPYGGLPRPDMLVTTRIPCLPQVKWWEVVREKFDVPMFVVDATMVDLPITDIQREHFLGQIRELIPFMEQKLGVSFHEDTFMETLKLSDRAAELWLELLDLRTAVPSPVGSREMCGNVFPLVAMLGNPKTIEFFTLLRDEAKQNVEEGKGAVEDEQIRLGWDNIPMWYNLKFFSDVEERNTIFTYETYLRYVWGGRMDLDGDPWIAFANKHLDVWLNYSINQRIKTLLHDLVKFKLDGFVFHQNRSCKRFSMGQRDLAQTIQEQIGVPSLFIESDMADPRAYAEGTTRLKMETFLEMLEAKKH